LGNPVLIISEEDITNGGASEKYKVDLVHHSTERT
jgi:hypothetical protein